VRAGVAFLDVPAERDRAADLDGAHDTQLIARECVGLSIRPAVSSENVGQLDSRPRHGGGYFRFGWPSGN
jgi:hypothetical protein